MILTFRRKVISPLKSNMVSTISHVDLIGRRVDLAITSFSLLFILHMTLFPFGFSFIEIDSNLKNHFLLLGWGKSNITDAMGNLLLFIPLGFGLAGYLVKIIRLPKLHSLLVIIIISFWLSYTIEIFQVFQPSRFPSLTDVFSNSVGGLLGFLCFNLYERKVKTSNTNRLIVFFGYLFCLKYITCNFFLSHLLANILLYIL